MALLLLKMVNLADQLLDSILILIHNLVIALTQAQWSMAAAIDCCDLRQRSSDDVQALLLTLYHYTFFI